MMSCLTTKTVSTPEFRGSLETEFYCSPIPESIKKSLYIAQRQSHISPPCLVITRLVTSRKNLNFPPQSLTHLSEEVFPAAQNSLNNHQQRMLSLRIHSHLNVSLISSADLSPPFVISLPSINNFSNLAVYHFSFLQSLDSVTHKNLFKLKDTDSQSTC